MVMVWGCFGPQISFQGYGRRLAEYSRIGLKIIRTSLSKSPNDHIKKNGWTWWYQSEITPECGETKSNNCFSEPSLYIPKIYVVPRRVETLHATGFWAKKQLKGSQFHLTFCTIALLSRRQLINLPIILKLLVSSWLNWSTYIRYYIHIFHWFQKQPK